MQNITKIMKTYIKPTWIKVFKKNKLETFEDFWGLPNQWFESPNRRRNGWSGVINHKIQEGMLFIKKQENHNFKNFFHPINGLPTFIREYENIQRFNQFNFRTPELLYFSHNKKQAILITKKIEAGFKPLADYLKKNKKFSDNQLKAIANELAHLHHHKIQHTYPMPKHLYLNNKNEVLFIDLEKAKKKLFTLSAGKRDLYNFLKFTRKYLSNRQLELFYKSYFAILPNKLNRFLTLSYLNKKLFKNSKFSE